MADLGSQFSISLRNPEIRLNLDTIGQVTNNS